MSPLAHVLQVAIVGGALVGVLVLLGGTATVDYIKARAAAITAAEERHEPNEVDPDDAEVDPDDPGAAWDRARDFDLDYRAGVA